MNCERVSFSIFLPVRNGWPYIEECVQSILNQTYPHFELVVLDNASTDGTSEWLNGLKDSRVRVVKSEKSLSIEDSWGRIKHQPKLEYMTMIGHDDLFDNNFLEIIKDLIMKHPDASLYQTGSRLINSKGRVIRSCQPVPESETAAQYLSSRLLYKRDVFGTGYVMRSADYDQLGGIYNFEKLFFADDALWLSLAKKSWKASDPREAFSVRIHPESESASLPSVWQSMLIGLNHFADFLKDFIKEDKPSRDVYNQLSSPFMLAYHRNIYIFALIDACRNGEKINRQIVSRIESSLDDIDPVLSGQLNKSLKVKLIELLNRSFLRKGVTYLWAIYGFIKTKSY